jgi:hypothetical protein
VFDFIKYAQDNKVSITIIPRPGKREIGTVVQDGRCSISGNIERGREQEGLDRMLAELGRRRAHFIGGLERSRKAEELEKFWRNE